ncbi:MAG: MATE family efflux transporter [Butyrivibrio sp.]|nr:MATE family efflux transporter [Butyrivibrio sp.]
MLVQALYNIVDSIFVAQINENALTAVTLAFPMQNLIIALASGTGVGVNSILSRALGEKKYDKSDAAANSAVLLSFVNYIIFLVIGILLSKSFIKSQTSVPEIIEYGETYLGIVSTLSIGVFFQVTFERLLQSTGRTFYSMISQMTGAIINIIMDPILIFGLLGFPKLGVAGAAYATIFGQVIASLLGLYMNVKFNKDINLSFKLVFKPQFEVIKEIYVVGIPSVLMMSIGSIMTYAMNKILIGFSTTATAVFGVYFKLQSFFFMPIFGLNNGVIPVIAYNYGARKRDRIKEALNFAFMLALSIMIVGMLIFELVPGVLLRLFNASEDMIVIGEPALRIIAIHFPLAALSIVMGSVFQAFAKSIYSLIVSVARQLAVLIPVAWLLSLSGNLNLVWLSFPIAEVVSLTVSFIFYKKVHKEIVDTL